MNEKIKKLPTYTIEEEKANALIHAFGAVFALATLIIFIFKNAHYSFLLYAIFNFVMYFTSALYHSRPFGSVERYIVRKIDHCDIFACIAFTYFPICMTGIPELGFANFLMVLEFALAAIGVLLNAFWIESKVVKVLSSVIYLLIGWAVVLVLPLGISLRMDTLIMLLLGGIIYTIGAVLYFIGSKKKWFHTVFHVFIFLASILQFFGILLLL